MGDFFIKNPGILALFRTSNRTDYYNNNIILISIKEFETVSSCLSSTANHSSSANLLWSILDSINRLPTYLYSRTVSIIFDHITLPMAYFANNQVRSASSKCHPKGPGVSPCILSHQITGLWLALLQCRCHKTISDIN